MQPKHSSSILASYATFKELYKSDKYKSPYQILAEFIRYVITKNKRYSYTATEIQGYLNDEFGFDPPLAVVTTALKGIDELTRGRGEYTVTQKGELTNVKFETLQASSVNKKENLVNALSQFFDSKNIKTDSTKLQQELISYVLEDNGDSQYRQVISEFILANNQDPVITDALSEIQEGGILFAGLANNISEIGSLREPLTLFLDTEILFDIAGLNGELYQKLAADFLDLVRTANRGGRIITLRYFPEVAAEIDNYYKIAESVVAGKNAVEPTQAMKAIIEGCGDIADVMVKKTEMLNRLATAHSIRKDNKDNYYTDNDRQFNLEGVNLPDYPNEDQANYEGIRFCSHINVLRRDKTAKDIFSSKFLFITDTRRVLEISHVFTESINISKTGGPYCEYAVSLSKITNLLWYKLNQGFSTKDFPKNLDAVVKARLILSGYITQNIVSTYKEIKERVGKGELTREQAVAYILALREKITLPEALNTDNVDASLNFSEDYFNRYTETIAQNKRMLKERNETIDILSAEIHELQTNLADANKANLQKQVQIETLAEQVQAIHDRENEKEFNKLVWKSRILLARDVGWKLLILVIIMYVIQIFCAYYQIDFGKWLSWAFGFAGLFGLKLKFIADDMKKHKERCCAAEISYKRKIND